MNFTRTSAHHQYRHQRKFKGKQFAVSKAMSAMMNKSKPSTPTAQNSLTASSRVPNNQRLHRVYPIDLHNLYQYCDKDQKLSN
eukprot:Awhi_evm1s12266